MAHMLCMMDNQGYRQHIFRICVSSCFCMATVVTWMCLVVMFVHTLLVLYVKGIQQCGAVAPSLMTQTMVVH